MEEQSTILETVSSDSSSELISGSEYEEDESESESIDSTGINVHRISECSSSVQEINNTSEWARYSLNYGFWDRKEIEENEVESAKVLKLTKEECAGILSRRVAHTGLSHLAQLPGTAQYAFTKLHLESKGLTDISILEYYNSLMHVDLSDNKIDEMKVFSNMPYLIFLNLRKNELSRIHVEETKPLFLTHLDISFNQIDEIPDLDSLWSLTHLNLSNNKIQSISGLWLLSHLEHLDLSHNEIEILDVRLLAMNLRSVDLSYNCINDWSNEMDQLIISQTLQQLNLAHNSLTTLDPLKVLYWLETLDISDNQISEVNELNSLRNMKILTSLNINGNAVWEMTEARGLLIHLTPSLATINNLPISSLERFYAADLFSNGLVHNAFKIYSWLLAKRHSVGPHSLGTDPSLRVYDSTVVGFVGPPGSYKWKLIQELCDKYPDFLRMGRLVTTRKECGQCMEYVTEQTFHSLLDTGKVVTHEFSNGFGYALRWDELRRDGKVLLVGLELSSALCMVWQGLSPKLILTMIRDKDLHVKRLKEMCIEAELYVKIEPSMCYASDVMDPLSQESVNEKKEIVEDLLDSQSSEDDYAGDFMSYDINSDQFSIDSTALNFNTAVVYCNPFKEELSKSFSGIQTDSEKSNLSICLTEVESEETIDFEYLEDLKYRPIIDPILESRMEYIDVHHRMPGMFRNTIATDEFDLAKKKLAQILREIYTEETKNPGPFNYEPKNDPLYEEIVVKNKEILLTKLYRESTTAKVICTTNEKNLDPNKAGFYFSK